MSLCSVVSLPWLSTTLQDVAVFRGEPIMFVNHIAICHCVPWWADHGCQPHYNMSSCSVVSLSRLSTTLQDVVVFRGEPITFVNHIARCHCVPWWAYHVCQPHYNMSLRSVTNHYHAAIIKGHFLYYEYIFIYDCIVKCSDLILSELSETTLSTYNSTLSTNQTSEEDSSAQSTSSGLFAGYKRRRVEPTSVSAQLASYIALCDEFEQSNVLTFWWTNLSHSSKLFPLTIRVLSVTASSAPDSSGTCVKPWRADHAPSSF